MSLDEIPRLVHNAIRAIISEEFSVKTCNRLQSRRNKVFHITGVIPEKEITYDFVAKWYQQTGIALESNVLLDAYNNKIPVPHVIGTTADVLLMDFIEGINFCDLITEDPSPQYGFLLGEWFATYHTAFSRTRNRVLLKGDARIRNFIFKKPFLFGVDFEECVVGSFLIDLAVACGSILDTDPIFTKQKLELCRGFLSAYMKNRSIDDSARLSESVTPYLIRILKETAKRRGNPQNLVTAIAQFESRKIRL
ncbi:MAG: hypothetical protein ACFFDP_09745 [Promethearchaeota archaeon]